MTGKKSDTVKLPLRSMKKKNVLRIKADSVSKVTAAQNSKEEAVGSILKEKKVSETRKCYVFGMERCGHHARSKHLDCRKSHDSKAVVVDTLTKQRNIHFNQEQLQQDIQTKKLNHHNDVLRKHYVPECPNVIEKIQPYDTNRKSDERCIETKLYEDSVVEFQRKRNIRALQHCSSEEQIEVSNNLQLLERRQKAEEVGRKSNSCTRLECDNAGSNRDGRRAGVDRRGNEHSTESARQHVRRGLYRAMSSR